MRIQHNIMAMNSYRNYNNNASALSKNLEKLSSGYKINRAGDDAAGLAISEKMRAQIKGLEAAQKNVKDGISLVKTAEGAMQEIQDMLSRMKYLATQSSNGTYDDDVDRKALQDEVDQLNSEINRIADSANFNGTKLLDGSLAAGGSSSGSSKVAAPTATGVTLTKTSGAKAKYELAFATIASAGLGDFNVSVKLNDKTYNYTFKVAQDASDSSKIYLYDENGKKIKTLATGAMASTHDMGVVKTGLKITKSEVAKAVNERLKNDLGSAYNVTVAGSKVTIEATEVGADKITSLQASTSVTSKTDPTKRVSAAISGTLATAGVDDKWTFSATALTPISKAADIEDGLFSINGSKFVLVGATGGAPIADEIKKIDSSITVIYASNGATNADEIAAQIARHTGLNVTASNGGTISIYAGGSKKTGGGGLQLQIGDTSDDFNQLMVTVGDLHANAIGVGSVDISKIDSAADAIDVIKTAINTVSSIRGKLGATQNRLEHTANNLSVMTENIQDAESTIRDTDVADEMMAYTKNNILIQSAQAMLAQANAVPQGVLQLLQ